jgi:hypothetical protein
LTIHTNTMSSEIIHNNIMLSSEKELDEKIYAGICVGASALQVCEDHGLYSYHVENIRGFQVCFL